MLLRTTRRNLCRTIANGRRCNHPGDFHHHYSDVRYCSFCGCDRHRAPCWYRRILGR